MKILILPALIALSVVALSARPADRGCDRPCACAEAQAATSPLILSESATEALRFQIDEERMARELYLALGEKWAVPPFRNIPRAEQRHHELLLGLAGRAGIAAVKTTVPGRYATAAVQSRYDDLLARGQKSLIEALSVGALVEEQDIADLRVLAMTTDCAELKSAVAALEQGSRHHLRAFVCNLRSCGIEYVPQVLPAADIQALIARRGRG